MHQEYGRLIWHILEEAGCKSGVLDKEEVIQYGRLIRCLQVGKRSPTLNSFKLQHHIVELQLGDRVMALPATSASSMMQQADITHVHQDAATGVRTYTLLFPNGCTREGVCRHDICTLGLCRGDKAPCQKSQRGDAEATAQEEICDL